MIKQRQADGAYLILQIYRDDFARQRDECDRENHLDVYGVILAGRP